MTMRTAMLASIFAAAAPCSSQPAPVVEQQRPAWDGRLMAPERVADHLWVMRQPDRLWAAVIGNVTIVEQSDGLVLVDSGGSIADGREIVEAVARLTPKPVKAVAITHWHNDHPLGLPGILAAFPAARVISTAATREFIGTETNTGVGKADAQKDAARRKRGEETIALIAAEAQNAENPADMRAQYALEARWIAQRLERQIGNHAVLPTEIVTDTLLLDDPVAPVELRAIGTANTRGDLIAWLPRQRILVAGDAVVLPTPYGFTSSIRPWLAALRELERVPFDVLIPGHGKVQRSRDYLGTLKWSMTDLAARAQAAAQAGLSKEQALTAFDRSEQERRFGATDAWTRKWLNDYWLEGMFGTAFDEARGIPAPGK